MSRITTVGERLRSLREKKSEIEGRRVTQAEVGDAVGISRSTLTAYEREHDLPGRDTMSALANFYNVSVDYLIGETPAFPTNPDDIAQNDDERRLLAAWRSISEEDRGALKIALRNAVAAQNSDAA